MGYTGRSTGNKPYDVYDKTETVSKAGVETITGQKTFTSPVKVADAILADEALSKGQLLAEIKAVDGAGSGLDADTVDGVEGALLGVGGSGYAWIDETANRALDTTYTNTTGKPIFIKVSKVTDTISAYAHFEVDGIVVDAVDHSGTASSNHMSLGGLVPDGSTYTITYATSFTVDVWLELK